MPATAIDYELTKWSESRKKGVFTAVVEWTLRTTISATAADMAPSQIAGLFAGLPVEGSTYVGLNALWPLATCRGVTCDQVEGGIYLYRTEWSDENVKDETQATSEDPLDDLPIIKPAGGIKERAITKDRNDEAILNAAGDPIAQSVEDNTINISVTANVAVTSDAESLVLSLRNKVNDAPIQVGRWFIGTNMARVVFGSNFLSEVKRRNEIEYLELNYELQIDERDAHKGVPLNAGFRQKIPVDPEADPIVYTVERILADDGSEPSEPVPLDADGAKLADPQPDTVVYLEVLKYEEGDFTALPGVEAWTP